MSYDGVDSWHGWYDWLRGILKAGMIVEDAFLRCKEKGFPASAEMCVQQRNKHLLLATVNRLAERGCRNLKTTPISNMGAWKEGGYGESISMDELYRLYLDYTSHYYEDGMPLSLMLGGFFSASPDAPQEYDIPSMKNCSNPSKTCVCGHARMVMYISAEGRALPCMALFGMDIQEEFPLIPEIGLAKCITDSRYMRLIDTCAACAIFKGGWVEKIRQTMDRILLRPSELTENTGFGLMRESGVPVLTSFAEQVYTIQRERGGKEASG